MVRTGRARTRRRGEELIWLKVGVPAELAVKCRELAVVRNESFAAFAAKALREYVRSVGGADDAESQFTLLNRKLTQLTRKQDSNYAAQLAVGETAGILLQLLLGSLAMPRTDAEKKRYREQVAERLPNAVQGIADNLLSRSFMKRFMTETATTVGEDFPKPPPQGEP